MRMAVEESRPNFELKIIEVIMISKRKQPLAAAVRFLNSSKSTMSLLH